MLAFEAFFLLPWTGFLATILLTILLRNKLKLIAICPLPTILGLFGVYFFAFIFVEDFSSTTSFLLLVLCLSASIGIFLTITTIVIVYAIKYRYRPNRSNKFVFAAACWLILYIFSYMALSRHGMQTSEKAGFEDCYFVTVPEHTDTWYLLHYTYSIFYCVPICIEDAMGTASYSWNAPLMEL